MDPDRFKIQPEPRQYSHESTTRLVAMPMSVPYRIGRCDVTLTSTSAMRCAIIRPMSLIQRHVRSKN